MDAGSQVGGGLKRWYKFDPPGITSYITRALCPHTKSINDSYKNAGTCPVVFLLSPCLLQSQYHSTSKGKA
jgi:hypothetical protein